MEQLNWHNGPMDQWNNGTMENGTIEQCKKCKNGTIIQWNDGTMEQWNYAAIEL